MQEASVSPILYATWVCPEDWAAIEFHLPVDMSFSVESLLHMKVCVKNSDCPGDVIT